MHQFFVKSICFFFASISLVNVQAGIFDGILPSNLSSFHLNPGRILNISALAPSISKDPLNPETNKDENLNNANLNKIETTTIMTNTEATFFSDLQSLTKTAIGTLNGVVGHSEKNPDIEDPFVATGLVHLKTRDLFLEMNENDSFLTNLNSVNRLLLQASIKNFWFFFLKEMHESQDPFIMYANILYENYRKQRVI